MIVMPNSRYATVAILLCVHGFLVIMLKNESIVQGYTDTSAYRQSLGSHEDPRM
jgi:hypothetical protein